MRNDGKLSFGVSSGGQQTVVSPAAYNDGLWHHVVATQGPAGMRLYVDGIERGANAAVTTGQSYTGYWRAGGDRCWTGTTSSYFAGALDEVAVYPRALPAAADRRALRGRWWGPGQPAAHRADHQDRELPLGRLRRLHVHRPRRHGRLVRVDLR